MHREHQVALYVRVSSEAQVDGYSLEAQEAVLRNDAKQRGKLVYKVYRDAGISGVREDRVGLNELLRDAREGKFGEVLVWTVSRISRKLFYLLQVIEELKVHGIAFRSISEQFDIDTSSGQLALITMGAVAQMQRESWIESSRIGMEKRAKSGRWSGGMMLGYHMVPDEDDPRGGGKLVIVPEEAETVRRIFDNYAAGLGYKAIVNRLNAEGKVGKTGKAFTSTTVRGILKNAAYIGKTRFGSKYYDGIHEAIVSEEVWRTVQDIMNKRSKPVCKEIDREYILSGVLKCPVCGSGMIPTHNKKRLSDGSYRYYYYYACGAYFNRGSTACKANSVRADAAEEKVLAWLHQFFTSPFWLRRVAESIRKRYEAVANPQLNEKKQAEQALASIAKSQSELLRQYEEEVLDKAAFLEAMQRIKAEKENWQAKLAANLPVSEVPVCWTTEDIRGAFRSFQQVLIQAKAEQKRMLIRNLISSVRVDEKRQVSEIEMHLMPALSAAGEAERVSIQVAI